MPDANPIPTVSRRAILRGSAAAAVGVLMLGVNFTDSAIAVAQGSDGTGDFAPDAFIRIGNDGLTTLIMPSVEMGQGIYTAIAMILAEELDLPLERVRLEAAPPNDALYANPILKIQMTGGSTSIRGWWTPLRKTSAAARAMLVEAAARGWNVTPASCRTQDAQVIHDATGRSIPYGALVAVAGRMKAPENVVLKDPKSFRLIGKAQHRLDTVDKVNGKLLYGIDAGPKYMKIATLAASPVFGGRVVSVDDTQAKSVPGFRQVIQLEDLVAVVGDHMWAAKQGLDALVIKWDDGAHGHVNSDAIRSAMYKASQSRGVVAETKGRGIADLAGDGLIEADYELPFLAHAAMEPMNCTVELAHDHCEIWVGTQVMTMAQRAIAAETGLPFDRITIHNHLIGGGFGRRLEVDGIIKAVRIARHVDGPVKVVWTREEDIQKSMYRPVYRSRMAARLENGQPKVWHHKVVGASILARFIPPAFAGGIDPDAVDGAIEQPYAIPDRVVEYVRFEPEAIPTCFWRGVGPNNTIFAAECFMDRLANKAAADPLAFRRSLLHDNPRALAVLDLAAQKAEWGSPLGPREGRGICLEAAFGSFIATIAHVAVADDGEVSVKRITSAVDCGMIVNPDGVTAQMQGGMFFGLSAALHGEITIANGRVEQSNFHDYRIVRMDEAPLIDIHLVVSGEAPGGIGEPGSVTVQPAVANAAYAAVGVQPNRMPIDRALLKKGIT